MKKALTAGSLWALPFLALAQDINVNIQVGGSGRFSRLQGIIAGIGEVIDALLPIAVGLALLAFFWGLAKFIYATGQGDESAVKTGKSLMVWGVVAFFVMISVWGIVGFIQSELGIGTTLQSGNCSLIDRVLGTNGCGGF